MLLPALRREGLERCRGVLFRGCEGGGRMSAGCYGDMYVVIGHDSKMRADKKMQTITFRTSYFTPMACNTLKEAKDFVAKVKHEYSADIVRLWNPIDRTELLAIADEIEESDADGCVDWHRRIREALGVKELDE